MAAGQRVAIQTKFGGWIVALERADGRPGTGEPIYMTEDYDMELVGHPGMRRGVTSGTHDYLSMYAKNIGLKEYDSAKAALRVNPLR
jgi:hypothetical protein